jgi:hypothetical protein
MANTLGLVGSALAILVSLLELRKLVAPAVIAGAVRLGDPT